MAMYTETDIMRLYQHNLCIAIANLCKVEVFCGTPPTLAAVNGWVFEQTVQHCLVDELANQNLHTTVMEQVRIGQRVVIDLLVATVAVEIKLKGLFGQDDFAKYRKAAAQARSRGLSYLYLTGQENHPPYREGIKRAVGVNNAFFLDVAGEWEGFLSRVTVLLRQ